MLRLYPRRIKREFLGWDSGSLILKTLQVIPQCMQWRLIKNGLEVPWWDQSVCLTASPEVKSKEHPDLELLHIKVRGFINLCSAYVLIFHPRETVSSSGSGPCFAYLCQHRIMCDKYLLSALINFFFFKKHSYKCSQHCLLQDACNLSNVCGPLQTC